MSSFPPKNVGPSCATAPFREEMHHYIGGILNGQDCPAIIAGGVEDHVGCD